MRHINYADQWGKMLTPEIVGMLTKIHEFKGEQNLFIEAHADELTELMEIAKIQSTEASNRIEGIFTSDERLKKLVMDKTTPKSRAEQEIAGYRDVLNTIHENYDYVQVKSGIILQLHRDLYRFMGSEAGGYFKTADNVIAEMDNNGNKKVRFNPVPAWETPDAIEKICEALDEVFKNENIDPLIVIPMFVLDFLCIHPFNDGNGRMSRLLTLLLLYRSGYIVGKYISIEKMIESSKETYYEALQASSTGWHEEDNNYIPFIIYMLGIVLASYREFSSRVRMLTTSGFTKGERIGEIIKQTVGTITKTEIMKKCPDISQITIQRALIDLQEQGKISKVGGGRYTKYIWNWDKEK
jgi:fic family protein